MSATRVFAIFLRQVYLIRSNPTRLASLFLWLIIDVVQWGFISRYLSTFGQAAFGFITVILGSIILWGFMMRIQMGIMMAFLEDIWSQNFINIFASPLRVGEYLAGMVITSTATSLAGMAIMVGIAGLGFGYDFFRAGFLLLPFVLILYVFGTAVGIFTAAVIFKLGPSAEWLGWPIPVVLSVFVGVYYPVSTLPPSFRAVSKFLPPSYVFESARGLLADGSFPAWNLVTGAVLAALYLGLAYRFFIYIYGKNLKNGAIARFNAESL